MLFGILTGVAISFLTAIVVPIIDKIVKHYFINKVWKEEKKVEKFVIINKKRKTKQKDKTKFNAKKVNGFGFRRNYKLKSYKGLKI